MFVMHQFVCCCGRLLLLLCFCHQAAPVPAEQPPKDENQEHQPTVKRKNSKGHSSAAVSTTPTAATTYALFHQFNAAWNVFWKQNLLAPLQQLPSRGERPCLPSDVDDSTSSSYHHHAALMAVLETQQKWRVAKSGSTMEHDDQDLYYGALEMFQFVEQAMFCYKLLLLSLD